MSTNTTTGNISFDRDELTEIIEQQQQQINELTEQNQQQQQQLDELETTVDEQQTTINDQADTINDQADTIDELQDQLSKHQEHDGKRTAELNQRVANVEDTIDDNDATDSREDGSSTDNSEGEDGETTTLERICALPEHVVEDNLTRNQQRARSVAQLVEEIGKSVPAGIAITSSRIKRALSAREDTTIHRQTVKRVADFLKRFGDGGVKIKETRGGKTTVVFDDQLADDVTGVVMDEGRGGVTPLVV